ncbi:MAG: hypothetical protein AAF600_13135 [Bacteroidota bacterium]
METTKNEFDGTIDTWFVKEYEGNKTIAEVTTKHCGPICKIERFDHPENKANAKLIAAAPKLLEALEQFIDFPAKDLQSWIDYGQPVTITVLPKHLENALSAISSALGE